MKKSLLLITLLFSLLVIPQHAFAGLSEGCFPAVTCPAPEDYYDGACNAHIETLADCPAPSPGYTATFNCNSGCGQTLSYACSDRDVNIGTSACCANGEVAVYNGSDWVCGQAGGKWEGTTDIYYDGGKVGIGATIPEAQLHITDPANSQSYLKIQDPSPNANKMIDLQTDANIGNGSYWIYANDTTDSLSDFVVRGDGAVGIGLTNPSSKLQISGGANDARVVIGSTSTNALQWTGYAIFDDNASDPWKFRGGMFVNNADKMKTQLWGGGGNVIEIQNTTPLQATAYPLQIWNNVGEAALYTTGSQQMVLGTNSTGRVWVKNNGRVGIGLSNPQRKLHVSGDVEIDGTTYQIDNSSAGSLYYFTNMNTGNNADIMSLKVSRNQASVGNCWLKFQDGYSDGVSPEPGHPTNRGIICGDGNGGIGIGANQVTMGNVGLYTNSPDTELHVHEPDNNQSVYMKFSNYDTGQGDNDGFYIGINNNDNRDAYLINKENTDMHFRTNNITRMTIDNAGRVGIGDSSPDGMLHVRAPSSEDYAMRVMVDGNTKFAVRSDGGTAIGANPGTGDIPNNGLYVYGDIKANRLIDRNNTSRSVDPAGNSYVEHLRIWGSTWASTIQTEGTGHDLSFPDSEQWQVAKKSSGGAYTTVFKVQADGDVYANGSRVHTSDERMKKNIENIEYGLDEIKELRPVSFTWKDRSDDEISLGLIAQEVQPIIGDIVHDGAGADENMLGLSYEELIPVLIKAMQEQQGQIELLQDEVIQLKQ